MIFVITGFIPTRFALLDAFSGPCSLGWEIFSNCNDARITAVSEDQLHSLSNHPSRNWFLKSRNGLAMHPTSNAPTSVPFLSSSSEGAMNHSRSSFGYLTCPHFLLVVNVSKKWERSFYYPHPNNRAGEREGEHLVKRKGKHRPKSNQEVCHNIITKTIVKNQNLSAPFCVVKMNVADYKRKRCLFWIMRLFSFG